MFTFCEKREKPTAKNEGPRGNRGPRENKLLNISSQKSDSYPVVSNNTIKNSKYGILYFVKLHA